MALVVEFTCELPNGVHARPASHVETLCNTFISQIEWHNLRTDRKGNAKSALAVIGTDTLAGDACRLVIQGEDEQNAYQQLEQWLREEFPHCDAPLAEAINIERDPLPESLARLNPMLFRALPVCSGSAQGVLTLLASLDLNALSDLPEAKDEGDEQLALDNGLTLLVKNIELRALDSDSTASAILEAHRSLATDTSLRQHLLSGVNRGLSCAQAIIATANHFCDTFSRSSSTYLQERVLDVRDVCYQLLQHIYGEARFPSPGQLTQPSVCLADDLTPGQFLELDKTLLKGLLLKSGGTTSHTVILARSFNIPTLVGVDNESLLQWRNQSVFIDGNAGAVVVDASDAVARYYRQEARVQQALREQQGIWLDREARTADGLRVEIAANIAHAVEAQAAFENGAEGVGLFRTEMLYMDRSSAPGENELYNIFCQALESANGRSIIVRTMDIGGDKPVEYLKIPAENNPFLGYRAVRIYEEYAVLFTTQLRAILRASAHGSLKIMIPMISSMEEILWVKEKLAEAKQQLRAEHIPFDEKIPLGIMLEVPSVMFIIDKCCEEIDFFSIGSNDLTQYLLAVDRDNAKVTRHYNSLNPAFLRALDYAVQAVHRQGKWIGLCGELGAKGSVLPLLVGLGLDELSMGSPAIPATKARLAQLDSRACRQLLNQAMACRTSLEVEHLLAQFRMNQQDTPLVTPRCISLDNDWNSKEEVMKGMTDNLLLAGRCRYPRKLEADLWAREAVFSTGLGFSFAIPHSKSEHIEQSTISVARLKAPVMWGDEEAQFIIMLTLNKHAAGDQHMRIFSRLARRIMHEDFRNALVNASSGEAIASLLQHELDL
ncbi:TPA: phosphoenolpyruvate--protein phosphotransferase [Enterobacter hormaechei]|uniref:phosphoenolpyruvate--protein phosphotransferase n=1 Tax=Enterobacter hormaechei TaxID=158836 RepID=UPI000D6F5113|nr:phosphoenolpyruvate--protein phosphotransferase [Enterobacter hormaechei]HAS0759295.1 phosphoenolpyruvate--protein phosphotransferase [Enterobacter hormaechei subsp. xiangfangensis]EKS6332447.1 phosphoenolpyruvate--protein phosphotransferase [Enterobacter hormaechei]EKS6511182.1 phosphoenolpyruvate--protein phosphotransferase [Enterobacter hormaechei]EKT4034207.1 phosphoenolpyruvate--protein phosphotransferase [Enterobacter hormaechei]EKZ1443487.1 phosphoenolpyruvate--protein phosphotransfe